MPQKTMGSLTADELKLLDLIVVIDHSGSMREPSLTMKGKSRWDEVHETTLGVAREAEKYDSDGITVITFARVHRVFDGVTADKVRDIFTEVQPGGSTMLAAAIDDVTAKAKTSSKDVVAVIFTDGEANDPEESIAALNRAGHQLGRPKIGFCFVQVGNDPEAAKFLDKIDNHMAVDVVATVRSEDAETLTIAELAWLARNA